MTWYRIIWYHMDMTTTAYPLGAPEADPNHIPREVWIISAVAMLGAVMSILDTTIVNVALATLGKDLHANLATIQWVVTGYMLSLAAVIPVTGWASRRFGAKRVFLISLILFTIGSLLCGLATSVDELIVFRVLQGLGGGMIMPIAQMIMADAAGPKKMGRVMGLVAVPMMLAPTLGPLLGGTIIEASSWRWIFYVNLVVGAVAIPLAIRLLPTKGGERTDTLDFAGLALMSTGLVGVTYGLAEAGTVRLLREPARLGADPRRGDPGDRLRLPRLAGRASPPGLAPVPQLAFLGCVDRDVLPWALRCSER